MYEALLFEAAQTAQYFKVRDLFLCHGNNRQGRWCSVLLHERKCLIPDSVVTTQRLVHHGINLFFTTTVDMQAHMILAYQARSQGGFGGGGFDRTPQQLRGDVPKKGCADS